MAATSALRPAASAISSTHSMLMRVESMSNAISLKLDRDSGGAMPWTSRPGANSRAREWAAGPGAVGSDLRARVSRGEKASMVPIMLGGWKKVEGNGASAGPGPAGRNEGALHARFRARLAFAARLRGADRDRGGSGAAACRPGQPLLGQFDPVGRAERDQFVVEVIARVVQHARPGAMAHLAVGAIAIANEAVGTRLDLHHVGKVFRAHGRLLHQGALRTDDAGDDLAHELRLGGPVDGRRVVVHELELANGTMRRATVLGHLPHAFFDQVAHLDGEGAHRAP